MADKYWRGNPTGDFDYDNANSLGPFDILDTPPENDTTQTDIGDGAVQLEIDATSSGIADGDFVEISGFYNTSDCTIAENLNGVFEVLRVDSGSTGDLITIHREWSSNYADAAISSSKPPDMSRRSNWVDENGNDASKPASGDNIIVGPQSQKSPSDIDERMTIGYSSYTVAGDAWGIRANTDTGITDFGDIIVTRDFNGHIGVEYDENNDGVPTYNPLEFALTGQLVFAGTGTMYARAVGGDVPLVIHNTESGSLHLLSQGVVNSFTDVLSLDSGELHFDNERAVDSSIAPFQIEDACRVDTIRALGTAEIIIAEKVTGKGTQIESGDVDKTADSTSVEGVDGSSFDDLDEGDMLAIGNSAGVGPDSQYTESRYVTSVSQGTPDTCEVHRPFNDSSNGPAYKLPGVNVDVFGGTIVCNGRIQNLTMSGDAEISIGGSDILGVYRIDIDELYSYAGTATWRARGILRKAEIDGGTVRATGGFSRTIGLGTAPSSPDDIAVNVRKGEFDVSDGAELGTDWKIEYYGGTFVAPENTEVSWT